MKGSFINGSIAEIAGDNGILPLVLGGESNTRSDRQLRGHDSITSIKTQFIAPHMHGAAFALATSCNFAKEFGHYSPRIHPFRQRMTMFPITAKNFVVRSQRGNAAHSNSLLAYIQVHKATNPTSCIFFGTLLLKAADESHLIMHL